MTQQTLTPAATGNPLQLRILTLLLAVFGVVILALVFVAYNAIHLSDEGAVHRQERLATHNLAVAIDTIPQQQRSATIWNEAVKRVRAGDETWMDDNLGLWMQDYFNHHENYVLDPSDRPLFASVAGDILDPRRYENRAAAVAPLLAQLRGQMADLAAGQDNPFAELADAAVVAPMPLADRLAIVSLVPIIPDSDAVTQPPGSEAVHIAIRYIDSQFAQDIGTLIELDAPAFTAAPPQGAQVGIPVTGQSGDAVAWLVWTPERAALALLLDTLPLLIVVGIVGGGILILCVSSLVQVSRRLQASEAQARLDLAALQQARAAATVADRAKMNFMSIVSHELRTPLTVILGYARLGKNMRQMPFAQQLQDRLHHAPLNANRIQSSIDEMLHFLTTAMEKIESSGMHQLFLVNQLLDYAKMEEGHMVLNREICDVQDVIAPVVEQMRVLTDQKGLVLDADHTNCTVSADLPRARQILINLLGNAIKFTDSGHIRVTVTDAGDHVRIAISDTGIGIAPDQITKIFDPFHQADQSCSRRAAGTGLGLSVAKQLALLGGGTITAQSTQGSGSIFTLSLPKEAASVLEKAA